MLYATHNTSNLELSERALTFQESLVACYKEDQPTSSWTIHPDYHGDLQVLLTEQYKELFGLKGASGVSTPRELKFRRSIEPPPLAPCDGEVRLQRQPFRPGRRRGLLGRARGDSQPPRTRLRAAFCKGCEGQRHQETT